MKRLAVVIAHSIKEYYPEVDEKKVQSIVATALSFSEVVDFCTDKCKISLKGHRVSVDTAYAAYCRWANIRGAGPISKNRFARDMRELGFKKVRMSYGMAFDCIILQEDVK